MQFKIDSKAEPMPNFSVVLQRHLLHNFFNQSLDMLAFTCLWAPQCRPVFGTAALYVLPGAYPKQGAPLDSGITRIVQKL